MSSTLEKKKSRTLFSLGKKGKKKEDKKDETLEKEDKKNEVDEELQQAHHKDKEHHSKEKEHHHNKEKEKEKESKEKEEDKEARKRSGSFRGWVTRKGRKGDKDDEDGGDTKEQGKESENEDEPGESGEVGADWRAIMATKRYLIRTWSHELSSLSFALITRSSGRSVLIILDNLTDETIMRRGAGKLSSGKYELLLTGGAKLKLESTRQSCLRFVSRAPSALFNVAAGVDTLPRSCLRMGWSILALTERRSRVRRPTLLELSIFPRAACSPLEIARDRHEGEMYIHHRRLRQHFHFPVEQLQGGHSGSALRSEPERVQGANAVHLFLAVVVVFCWTSTHTSRLLDPVAL
jgi:hypothetical protein